MLSHLNERSKESFAYSTEIAKPFGGIDFVISWCKQEMLEDWRWQVIRTSTDQLPGRYVFYFDSDRDYLAFILKWS